MSAPEGPVSSAPVNPGDVLAGKYRVEKTLGNGAMGVVVAALHVGLGQRVAMKFLLPHRVKNEALQERFLREARAAGCLKSQHVTRVSDVGTLENGAPYMVMELLEGHDLAAELDERGAMPIPDAVECVLQVCEAVGEAHRAGIVHRDLKPANLFLARNPDGSPCMKVLDFGVSKLTGAGHLKLTAQGQFVGSPLYMSPEQMQGKPDVDARSDIWAIGVILFELIAGKTPFDAENLMGLQTQVLIKPPAPLTRYVPHAPPALEAIILQCLDKRPERRWQNLADLAAALARFAPPRAAAYAARVAGICGVTAEPSRPTDVLSLERARLRASEPAADVPASAAVATTGGATSRPAGVPPVLGKGPLVAGAGVVLVALALGGVGLVRWRTGTTAAVPLSVAAGPSVAPPAATTAEAPSAERPPPPLVEPPAEAPATAPTGSATASARVVPAASPTRRAAGPTHTPATKDPAPMSPASPDTNVYGGRR